MVMLRPHLYATTLAADSMFQHRVGRLK